MSDGLAAMRDVIQEDIGGRGLRNDPTDNLITAYPDDFAAACRSIAETRGPKIAVVTGFHIPTAEPPCSETDGPLGALYLARALVPLGIRVVLASDGTCVPALAAGLADCGLSDAVPSIALPLEAGPDYEQRFREQAGPLTHLVALERVGPSAADGVCRTMRGRDVTAHTSPAHRLFEDRLAAVTVGIGDGGNEIGMGKIARATIARNIPNGDSIACRVGTDYLIVCGISNWGAYGLAAGVRRLLGHPPTIARDDVRVEMRLLELMVERGPLVDGALGKRSVTVDGIDFDRYAAVLGRLADC